MNLLLTVPVQTHFLKGVEAMVTTKGRYAIRVMIDLAEHDTGSFIPLKDIAARQGISKKYLEIIVKSMVSGGLLVGRRI